jgi:hypothetical protein
MKSILKTTAAALAAAMMMGSAALASTTTIDVGDLIREDIDFNAGEAMAMMATFTAARNLSVNALTVSVNGSQSDIQKFTINFNAPNKSDSRPFDPINPPPGAATSNETFAPPKFIVLAGQQFSIELDPSSPVDAATFFDITGTTAPVPVPAAGVLLLSVMAAGGVAARRRSRKAATA